MTKPATALPWRYQAEGRVQFGILGSARLPAPSSAVANYHADAAYIAHSANAYPRLVEALRKLERACYSQGGSIAHTPVLQEAGALLRELGELS